MSFELDERLARDTFVIGDLPLSRVLLMNDARWPWLILVPRRAELVELMDLELARPARLMDEAARAARFLKSQGRPTRSMWPLSATSFASSTCMLSRASSAIRLAGAGLGAGAATPYEDDAASRLIAAARKGLSLWPATEGASE